MTEEEKKIEILRLTENLINMSNKAIQVMNEAGIPIEKTRAILKELTDNASDYSGNQPNIEKMLLKILTIDEFITIKNLFISW